MRRLLTLLRAWFLPSSEKSMIAIVELADDLDDGHLLELESYVYALRHLRKPFSIVSEREQEVG